MLIVKFMCKNCFIVINIFLIISGFLSGCGNLTPKKEEEKMNAEDTLKLARTYNDSGLSYARNEKDYNKAIYYFNKSIETKPNYDVAFSNRGNAYRLLKEYDKAIADINKAIQISPNDTLLHHISGRVYKDSRQYEQAIEEFSKVIEMKMLDSTIRASIYVERGQTYFKIKKKDLADKDFRQATLFDPTKAIEQ